MVGAGIRCGFRLLAGRRAQRGALARPAHSSAGAESGCLRLVSGPDKAGSYPFPFSGSCDRPCRDGSHGLYHRAWTGGLGLLFALFPQLDLILAQRFFDGATAASRTARWCWAEFCAAPRCGSPGALRCRRSWAGLKLIFPDRPLLIYGRTMVFPLPPSRCRPACSPTSCSRAIGRVRARSRRTSSAGSPPSSRRGTRAAPVRATARSIPAKPRPHSGPMRRLLWRRHRCGRSLCRATVFGVATGSWRMTFGGHYATDVIFAGIATFLIVWLMPCRVLSLVAATLRDEAIDRWNWRRGARDARNFMRPDPAGRKAEPLPQSFWWLVAILSVSPSTRCRLEILGRRTVLRRIAILGVVAEPAFGYFSKPPLLAWIIARRRSRLRRLAKPACARLRRCFYSAPASSSTLSPATLYDARVGVLVARCAWRWLPGMSFRAASSRPTCRCCSAGRWRCWLPEAAAGRRERRWGFVLGLVARLRHAGEIRHGLFRARHCAAALVRSADARALLRQRASGARSALRLSCFAEHRSGTCSTASSR